MARATSKYERRGIFGPEWHRWRLAVVRVEPPGKPAYSARLQSRNGDVATLSKLDPKDETMKHTIGDVELSWPPTDGTKITVIRQ